MSDHEADWLALREPYDHAARCVELTTAFVRFLDADTRIIDLGCGTGSNFRYLSPRLAAGLRWRCIDHDREVLSQAAKMSPDASIRFERRDLSRELSSLPLGPGTAITTSAFLDLTSATWLDQLVSRCDDVPLLAVMSFNGRIDWQPAAADDEAIRRHVVAHQRTDKGFGPALGPDAVGYLAEQLKRRGHRVTRSPSDWQLDSGDRALMEAMVGGIARRVRRMAPDVAIDRWLEMRGRQVDSGELQLTVGHEDLLAIP